MPAYRDLLADVRSILGSGTKIGYAADWSEYFGHQPGDGSGDVFFHLDPLWADTNTDFIGIDNYMPLSDWRDGFEHADAVEGWPAIYDRAYLQGNISGGEGYDWFYASAADRTAQVRTPITDGGEAGNATGSSDPPNGKPWVFRYKDLRAWWSNLHYDRPGGVESGTPTAWVPQSKPIWFTELGCPAIDRGTNQPNVFFDPKSSESFTPHFSRGWRDDAIQRAYLEATYLWWDEAANNPISSAYGGRMVHVPECAAWTWDARPYPFFPALTDLWTDGANWRLGHWLTGRLGAVSLAALVRHLCLRAGLPGTGIDVTGLWGAVEGYAMGALESPRASITTLSRHFGFDAVETEGMIRFAMRGRASITSLTHDDLVAAREGDLLELTRAQETELPQALKWQVARADEDYDAALVEAQRITVDTTRIASESFPMAVPPEEAERRCRRALMEAWTGRETTAFRLPPSRLALDPADVVTLAHDGRHIPLRLVSIADAEARGIEAVRQDREAHDLPPGSPRPSSLSQTVVFGAPEVALLDLPQLTEDQPAHRPFAAAHAVPWPGEMAVFRSSSTDGFELLTTFGGRARIGTLVSEFYAGPTSRFDFGNALVIDLLSGTLESVTDLTLFGGANAIAVESAPGIWEIVQAGAADLIAPGRYRLTRLLRGQRGTEGAMGDPAPVGARMVVLDEALASLSIAEADLGLPWNWRIGPASRSVSDETYVAASFNPVGVGLRPFSVAHVEQPWRKPRATGDLTIRWTRRSRALAADSWGGLEVPLAEELEAYEVEILDGMHREAGAEHRLRTQRGLLRRPADLPTGARCSRPATRSTSASPSSPPSIGSGRAENRHAHILRASCPTPRPICCYPYILAAQAQKHVTHNEALRLLDGLVQLSVLDRDLTAPPGSPADGDRYIVASGGDGRLGRAGIRTSRSGPTGPGFACHPGPVGVHGSRTKICLLVYDGTSWVGTTPAFLQNMALLGARHDGRCVEPVLGQAERRALDCQNRCRGRHRRSVLHYE